MNNKAFTLVELIAIIVVLAAIFLVSFPTLINTVKSDEIKKYDDMVEDLCLAGESYIYNNIDEFSELSTKGSTVYLNISTLIDYGSVNKDIKNPKTNEMINSDYIIFNVLGDNSMSCNYKQAKCIITNDNDNSRNLSNWDEVVCGTESFYIIPNDPIAHPTAVEDNVTLLAKYNLNVGSDLVDGVLGIQNKKAIGMQYDSDGNEDYTSCNFTTEQINDFFGGTLGRADDDYIDFYNEGFGCNGTLPFSTTDYWAGVRNRTFVYNENSLLYPYVEDYKKYIQTFGLNVKEASIPSVNQIYNDEVENTVNIQNKGFWLGNVRNNKYIYSISSKGFAESYAGIYNGVRPVIIVSKTDIEF